MSSRPRTQSNRSCTVCHRRKVRCDKKSPCSGCIRSGFECSYPPAAPPARRPRKTTINDVASRISEMEKTIEAFKAGKESSPQPPASISSVTSANTSIPTPSSEDDVRIALSTPRDEPPHDVNSPASHFNPMGLMASGLSTIPIANYHPPRRIAIRLWKVFVECVDVCAKVVHVPSCEMIVYTVASDPSRATIESLGLCFAIYYSSVTALTPEEVLEIIGEEKNQVLHRYRICIEQSLAQADFLDNPTLTLLQALAIYSASMRVHGSGRAVWIMNGLALRAAQSIGLHRDGTKLGLSPFESEIRRRVWWHFLERDGRGAEDYGLQNPSGACPMYGVEHPRNLHDSDMFPEMTELPPSRPDWTRMTLPLCNVQASRAWAQLFQMSCSPEGLPGEDVRKRVIKEAMDEVEGILQRCNPVIPEQRMTIRISRLVLSKVDVVSRRQWQILRSPDDIAPMSTDSEVAEAINLLELANCMWQDEDMVAFRWVARAYPQYHMMLYILRHLCVCPRGPLAKRGFATVDIHLENFKLAGNGPLNGLKWTVLTTLRERAFLLLQKVEAENVRVQQEMTTQMGFQGNGADMQGKNGDNLAVPDWNMILEEFPLDMDDFSIIF
ncbi:hypothetical protein F53441_10428 [Fusarium austroafricanum]|uniref:Zn(2)-C6 fungal-type domain-containing protein n=1 Tax=Fusarium austroafricanum TaxID=2364996 RepID=A0A8H4K6Y5_9HYPO|nr:hypothetical protein F53441_10428 [Fusarium austroafricanum]